MPPKRDALERFNEKWVADWKGCWVWSAYRDPNGYGRFNLGGKVVWAHRAAWQLYCGPIPQGLTLDHLCRFHACVNPNHLEPVTHKVNMRRGQAPRIVLSRTNRCLYGHDLTDSYRSPRTGWRRCRICASERRRERTQRDRDRTAYLSGLDRIDAEAHETTLAWIEPEPAA